MDLDASLQDVGQVGRLQITNIVIFWMASGLGALQFISIAFTVDQSVAHYCKTAPPGFTANDTTVVVDEEPAGCEMHQFDNDTLTENVTNCQYGWEYAPAYGERSAVTDFDLVCDRSYLANLLISIHFAGALVGGTITGQAADMFGRRVVVMATSLVISVLGTAISFTWNLQLLMVLRFLLSVAIPGSILVSFVRIVEMFTAKNRLLGDMVFGHSWAFGVMLVAPFAYLFPNWRDFQLFTSLICLPLPIIMWFFTYESIRWLVQKGWLDKAEAILQKIAKSKNIKHDGSFIAKQELEGVCEGLTADVKERRDGKEGNTYSEEDDDDETNVKIEKKFTVLDLFKTKVLIQRTCIIFGLWIIMNATYYGLLVYTASLAGNKYLNFFLLAVSEVPCYSVNFYVLRRFGRRRPLIVYFFAGAVVCLLVAFLPGETGNGMDLTALIIVVAMIGKFFANATFDATMLVGAEIYPTMLRNIATGCASTVGRASGIVAPFIVSLKEVRGFLPMLIFGCMSLVACALVLVLPETKDKPLPETCEDANKLTKD